MLAKITPQDLTRLSIPIGIAIAAIVILAIPALRRSIIESFTAGHQAGERARRNLLNSDDDQHG